MNDVTDYLTKEKFEELSRELEDLKTEKRKEVAESLEYAKSLGDLSENAEYHEARALQANIEDRIAKLELMLKTAVIIDRRRATDAIGIGSTVTLRKEKGKEDVIYKIVGSEESDIGGGKLSIRSPLGEAVVNKKKGDQFSFDTPKGKVKYLIVSVS